ncbi:alpha/beta fold hydrolase [Streptosporangium sp. G11]|uniref:alpha/beta fold hydrolase n=1 Tax=Streptosporangium sp. G11 TaxID=3436926 RepID=UPI003EC0BD15
MPISLRTAATFVAGPAMVGGLLMAATAPVQATSIKKPTIVLVHGAFADASSWNGVIKELKRDGYPVLATANPLRGLSSDAAYLKSVLKGVKGSIVLVGHSYGGAVISQAATGNRWVKSLVYIAAFLPAKGESALDLSGKYPGSTLGPNTQQWSYPLPGGGTGVELTIKQDKYRQQFAADVPKGLAAVLAATQRPIAVAALEEKAATPAWKSIPAFSLIATGDKNIPPAAQRWMARRAHARTVEVKASHAVAVSRPHRVAQVIEIAAEIVSY